MTGISKMDGRLIHHGGLDGYSGSGTSVTCIHFSMASVLHHSMIAMHVTSGFLHFSVGL